MHSPRHQRKNPALNSPSELGNRQSTWGGMAKRSAAMLLREENRGPRHDLPAPSAWACHPLGFPSAWSCLVGVRCPALLLRAGFLALCLAGSAAADLPPKLPSDPQLKEQLQALTGPEFRLRETDHFTIAYDTSYEVLRTLISRLEWTFRSVWRFCEQSEVPVHPPEQRLTVILFEDYEAFRRHGETVGVDVSGIDGFYHNGVNRAAFCNTLNRPDFREVNERLERLRARLQELQKDTSSAGHNRKGELRRELVALESRRDRAVKRINQLILQHEAAHHVMFNIGVHVRGGQNPVWLSEGLATQFEVTQGSTGAGRVAVNHVRLADLRDALGVDRSERKATPALYETAFTAGRLVPLERLVADDGLFQLRGPELAVCYAQAWGLTLFLQREHPEAFARYLTRLAQRHPRKSVTPTQELAEFEAAFGPLDTAWQRNWLDFVLKLPYDPSKALR